MRLSTLCLALGWCSACGPAPTETRTVRLRPTERVFENGAVVDVPSTAQVVWWGPHGAEPPPSREADGTAVFEVPLGAALFEVDTGLDSVFVYGDDERFEPCTGPRVPGLPVVGGPDGGTAFELTLAQPAAEGDALFASNTLFPFTGLDAGLVEVRASSPAVFSQLTPATVTHFTRDAPIGGVFRSHAVGIFDAGVLTRGEVVRGRMEPLNATTVPVDWDGAALESMLSAAGHALPSNFQLHVRGGWANLASAFSQVFTHASVPLEIPAGADHLEVWDNEIASVFNPGFGPVIARRFAWAEPWSATPALRPPSQPPRNVTSSADFSVVSWTAPSPPPDAYIVTFSTTALSTSRAYTRWTAMPIPPALRVAGLRVEVMAVKGGGVSAQRCPWDFQSQGAPWWQLTSTRVP